MNLLSFFRRRNSAPVARERLQILLAHERTVVGGQSDLVAILREEIMAVIAKHIAVGDDQVQIKMDRGDSVSTLEVDIEIPTPAGAVRLAV
jgi:cell division topological specificity factor